MKFLKAITALVLFTLICVSSAGASGIVKFHIPEISNAAVGDTVDATLYVDNNLNPLSSDIALNLDWNNEVIQYVGTDFTTGHTTVAEPIGSHLLTLNIGDHTSGIAAGDVPAAHIKFKVIGPGTSPIVIKIDKVLDLSGADITSKAVAKNGAVTATGTAIATTTTQTQTQTQSQTPATVIPTTTTTTGTSSPATITTPVQGQVINFGPATVPFNTGVFAVSSIGNVAVGQTGAVTVYVDNAWNPQFGDTYIDLFWDSTVAQYISTDIRVSSNTTAAEGGDGHMRIALGDFKNGYPTGTYPIATVYLKALKDGTTPLTVTIDHVRYWSSDLSTFTDITASATTQNGVFSTGAVAMPTQVISTVIGNPVTVATQYITPSGPVSFGDSSSSSGGDSYTGVGGEPTTRTIATTVMTTVPTTMIPTPVINQTSSEPTLVIESTTLPTTVQTVATTIPTTQKSGAGFGMITLIGLTAAGLLFLAARKN